MSREPPRVTARWGRIVSGQIVEARRAGVRFWDAQSGSEEELSRLDAFWMEVHGPPDSPYEGGSWRVSVQLTPNFPHASPSVAFKDAVWHPNVEALSGAVCLDVLNTKWTAVTTLESVAKLLLPALLGDPNAGNPFNLEAAHEIKNLGGAGRGSVFWVHAARDARARAHTHTSRALAPPPLAPAAVAPSTEAPAAVAPSAEAAAAAAAAATATVPRTTQGAPSSAPSDPSTA
jgi:ubiquitin-protein ligase